MKYIRKPKHKSSTGNLLNTSGALEAVMQYSDFMQINAGMTDKNPYLKEETNFH